MALSLQRDNKHCRFRKSIFYHDVHAGKSNFDW